MKVPKKNQRLILAIFLTLQSLMKMICLQKVLVLELKMVTKLMSKKTKTSSTMILLRQKLKLKNKLPKKIQEMFHLHREHIIQIPVLQVIRREHVNLKQQAELNQWSVPKNFQQEQENHKNLFYMKKILFPRSTSQRVTMLTLLTGRRSSSK